MSNGLRKSQSIAKRPNALIDYFQLALPFPWKAVATSLQIQLGDLKHYGILLSLTMPLYLTARRSRTSRNIVVPLLTAWSSVCLWKMATPLYMLISGMKIVLSSSSVTHDSAWECMAKRIEQGLLYRRRQYDLYLPPEDQEHKPSVLFFPGACVPHESYAEPISQLADAGHTVVVVSAELLKLTDHRLPRFRPGHLQTIMKSVNPGESHWVLMGHSMGSFLCTKLAIQLPNVRAVVMWGAAPFVQYMGDLSGRTDLRVLVVQASNDIVIDSFATPELTETFYRMLPSNRTVYEIQDGTHSGFASYQAQWKPEVEGLPVKQQHKEAVSITLSFLEGAQ